MELTDLADADAVLFGVGLETLSVLPHLRGAGVGRLRIVESATPRPDQAATLQDNGIEPDDLLTTAPEEADVVLRSPGVPTRRDDVAALCATARLATSPTGLWLALRGGAGTVAVTGTKGKSSTATLIMQGLTASGVTARLVGNIGTSAWDVDPHVEGVAVVELSSYQGADLIATGEVAVLTLLADDHLDWHGSADAYRHDKLRVLGLGLTDDAQPAARFALDDQTLPEPLASQVTRIDTAGDYRAHNTDLAVAAIRAELELRGVPVPEVANLTDELAASYPDLPSRFEVVPTNDGITWVDDALGSNPSATAAALERIAPGPAVLICGGHDRHVPLDPVLDALSGWPDGSLTVIWLGAAEDPRIRALAAQPAVAGHLCADSMAKAVTEAAAACPPGGSVVFSPLAPTERAEGSWSTRAAAFRDAIANLP